MKKNTIRRVQLDLETLEARDVPSALSLGTAGGYAVLGLENTAIVNFDSSVTGDEGVSKGGSLRNALRSTITGDVNEFSGGQYFGRGKLDGTLSVDPAGLTLADSAALAASTQADALTATQTFKNIDARTTLTGNGGVNVIDISGDITNSLILSGTAGDVFIVNVKGSVDLDGSESLGLAGGVTANHVLYNFIGARGSVSARDGTVIDGTLLGPTYGFDLEGKIDGEIISGREVVLFGAKVTAAPFSMPVATPPGLSGFVLDNNGNPVSGITVDLENSSGTIISSAVTSSTGAYSFTGLTAGTYQLAVVSTRSWQAISSQAGTVNGTTDGSSVSSATIGSIVLANGNTGINYDFTVGAGG
jgi:choice-of-anchor A domain-containing protein